MRAASSGLSAFTASGWRFKSAARKLRKLPINWVLIVIDTADGDPPTAHTKDNAAAIGDAQRLQHNLRDRRLPHGVSGADFLEHTRNSALHAEA
jgi:hypothetical protein